MNNGFIQLHRQLLEWEWYTDQKTFKLFLHCLLKANYKDKTYRGTLVKRGTFLTSLQDLATETGLSVQNIRTALANLESTHELTSVRSSQGTVIQVVKYEEYQIQQTNQHTTNTPTNKQTNKPSTRQLTTTNNINKENKEINNTYRAFNHLSLSNEDFTKLRSKWTKEQIDLILDAIENHRNNKNYNSLYLTANNWLKKQYPLKEHKELTPQEIYEAKMREALKLKNS